MELIQSIDYNIISAIMSLRFEPLTAILTFITRLGDHGMVWIIISLLCLLRRKTRICGIAMLLALFLSHIAGNVLLKPFVARLRPFLFYDNITNLISQGGYSFPSGHSAASFAAATVIHLFFAKQNQYAQGIVSLVLAALIAFSRIYLGVHYASDIVCGALLGAALAFFATSLVRTSFSQVNF